MAGVSPEAPSKSGVNSKSSQDDTPKSNVSAKSLESSNSSRAFRKRGEGEKRTAYLKSIKDDLRQQAHDNDPDGKQGMEVGGAVIQRKKMTPHQMVQYLDIDTLPKAQRQVVKELFDADGNGEIDLHELIEASLRFRRRGWMIVFLMVLCIFSICAVFGVSIAATEMSKESRVGSDGIMRDAWGDSQVVKTGAVQSFVRVSDLPSLPLGVLEELNHVTLSEDKKGTTIHHHYKIAGFRLYAESRELMLKTSIPGVSVRFKGGRIHLFEAGQPAITLISAETQVPSGRLLSAQEAGKDRAGIAIAEESCDDNSDCGDGLICVSAVCEADTSAASNSADETMCILPFGDSITQGSYAHASYRYSLYKLLCNAGDDFHITGSHNINYGDEGCVTEDGFYTESCKSDPGYVKNDREPCNWEGFQAERFHEGHAGWRTQDHLINPLGNYGQEDSNFPVGYPGYITSGTGNIVHWVPEYTCAPTCVLMHLGTNDMVYKEFPADTVKELRDNIDALKKHFPDITTLLAIPISTSWWKAAEKAYLAECQAPYESGDEEFTECFYTHWQDNNMTKQQNAIRAMGDDPANRIFLVDVAEGYDPRPEGDFSWNRYDPPKGMNQADGLHPNKRGEDHMAAKFYAKIKEHCLLPTPTGSPAPTPVPTPAPQPGIFEGAWQADQMKVHIRPGQSSRKTMSAQGDYLLAVDYNGIVNGDAWNGCFGLGVSTTSTASANSTSLTNSTVSADSTNSTDSATSTNSTVSTVDLDEVALTQADVDACTERNVTVFWPPGSAFGGAAEGEGKTYYGYMSDPMDTTITWVGKLAGVVWNKMV